MSKRLRYWLWRVWTWLTREAAPDDALDRDLRAW
jgi:hypothetical protein